MQRLTILALSAFLSLATLPVLQADLPNADAIGQLATPTKATANHAPAWTKGGTFVYRMSTPDVANVLPDCEQGFGITQHLLDDSVHQIVIANGLVGSDHKGPANWDGLWPDWDHVTFRAVDWKTLGDFMLFARDKENTYVSFHVNLTDVNAGLRDLPESQAFFQKLVETKSMYRRDINPATHKRDTEPPYVPTAIPADATRALDIIALVNYENFYQSGLGPKMIDDFYGHLPYAPPLIYLDVLTLSGGNFSTGFPTAPLGGSEQTQLDGARKLVAYVNAKGSSVATEGDRDFLMGKGATYGWLHCFPGYSSDDYSYIAGTAKYDLLLHVAGNTGCFNVSPIASTPEILAKVRSHYANLLAGKPDEKIMPGLDTWHVADRSRIDDEFDMIMPYDGKPGIGGDPYRGDWADLVNDFYLTGIQELYHLGNGAYRSAIYNKNGMIHVTQFGLTDATGKESLISALDVAPAYQQKAAKQGIAPTIAPFIEFHFNAPQAGTYNFTLYGGNPGNGPGAINVYANGQWQGSLTKVTFPNHNSMSLPVALGEIPLNAGDNIIAVDSGPVYMRWSDGTIALWTTPYLHKGFSVTNGDLTLADDYSRMWPDTWSGQKKIYFFSWDGTGRGWKLPADWSSLQKATLYPLTPDGRGTGIPLAITDRSVSPKLLPQIPYVLVP